MSPEKLSILKYLNTYGSKSAVDIAKNFCGENLRGYNKWYARLHDLKADELIGYKNDDNFPSCSVVLFPSGEDALADEKKKLRDKRVESIRYIITTAIALVALVFSIIAITAELGWLELPQA